MAITTVMTVTEHGITLGLSDTLNVLFTNGDLTVDNIAQFATCGWSDLMVKRCKSQAGNPQTDMAAAITVPQSPWQTSLDAGNAFRPYYNNNVSLDNIDFYGINFLIYGANNASIITNSVYENYRIVTSISDYQKLYADGGSETSESDYNGTVITCTHTADGTPKTYTCMNPCGNHKLLSSDDDGEMNIQPFACVPYNDTFFIMKGFYFPGLSSSGVQTPGWTNYIGVQNYYLALKNSYDYTQQTYRLNGGFNIRNLSQTTWLKTWGNDTVQTFLEPDDVNEYNAYYVLDEHTVMLMHRGNISWGTCDVSYNIAPKDWDTVLHEMAFCGVKFKVDNKVYRPIISGGVVTGYTDDPDVESEYDNITNVTGNNVPVTPPGPTPPEPGPYNDDPWSGVSFSGTGVGGAGAFAKVYYMTSTELANLRSWMNSINVPEGFDPMQQIIGLSQVPVALSGSSPENVVFVNSSAVYDPGVTTRAVDTGVSTQQSIGTPISYYLGSVDIVRRMQERGEPYLDYDCQIELYLPLIGMFSLDTQAVMGRTISAYAVLDPVSGTLAAYAYVTKDGQNLPVAYGSTSIGVDLPVSAQQLSVSRAALKQANAQLGTSLLSSALSLVAMSSAGGAASGAGAKTSMGASGLSAAGIREAGSDYMKASQVGNVFGDFMQWGRTIRQLSYGNNTAISGSFGGSTAQWSYPFTPYVKIIRPRYEKPSNYAHSQGVPCVQTKTVGSCTGFIQCINPDVSGITGATDLELQAIQAALSNGIYAGGGS